MTHALSSLRPTPERLTSCERGLVIAFDASSAGVTVEAVGGNDRFFSIKVPISVRREELIVSNARCVTTMPISSVAVQLLVAASQSLTVLSRDADASVFESWENATELTQPLCPSSVAVHLPVAASQSLTVLSRDADASVFESWENATDQTELLCPSSVAVHLPVAASQSLTVLSSDADASVFESWENATELTQPLCPSSVWMHASQSKSTFGSRASQAGN